MTSQKSEIVFCDFSNSFQICLIKKDFQFCLTAYGTAILTADLDFIKHKLHLVLKNTEESMYLGYISYLLNSNLINYG